MEPSPKLVEVCLSMELCIESIAAVKIAASHAHCARIYVRPLIWVHMNLSLGIFSVLRPPSCFVPLPDSIVFEIKFLAGTYVPKTHGHLMQANIAANTLY